MRCCLLRFTYLRYNISPHNLTKMIDLRVLPTMSMNRDRAGPCLFKARSQTQKNGRKNPLIPDMARIHDKQKHI